MFLLWVSCYYAMKCTTCTDFNIVLHLYYKLTYIKMAWGGPNEQKAEIAAGNLNAQDWYNDTLKVVEKTMEEYWNDYEDSHNTVFCQDATLPLPLMSDYDLHHHQLVQESVHVGSGGWKEELC